MKLKPLCLAVAVVMTGCGGGGGGDSKSTSPTITPEPTTTLSGSAVKGPLVNAVVRAYALDTGAADLKGTLLGSGSTDAQAAISGLAIPAASSGPVLLEILADVDTVDLTTGATPVITRMVTVRDAAELMAGKVYATPLTTMVVELARTNGDKTTLGYGGNGDSSLSTAEFLAALPVAQAQVKSSLGFGLVDDVDLLAQSPLITGDTADAASQNSVLAYRTAIEGIAAIAEKLKDDALAANAGSSVSTDDMFAALAADLSDGTIDGQDANGALPAMADLADVGAAVTVDPATLMIPGTTTPLTEVSAVLIAEKADTGISTDTTDIENAQTAPAVVVVTPDSDGDGVNDLNDVFPLNPDETVDSDGDGVGDNADMFDNDPDEWIDSDNDGVGDNADAFDNDPTETVDSDGDGVGDNADMFDNDPDEWIDSDNDGVGDNADAFDNDPTETVDSDGDGVGDNADMFDNDPTEWIDSDNDGVGDNADAFDDDPTETVDSDGDGVGDNKDAFDNDPTETTDTDGDGIGDNSDAFPDNADESADTDGDQVGDNADNCPTVSNADQADADDNGIGDACDSGEPVTGATWDQFNWDDGSTWQ